MENYYILEDNLRCSIRCIPTLLERLERLSNGAYPATLHKRLGSKCRYLDYPCKIATECSIILGINLSRGGGLFWLPGLQILPITSISYLCLQMGSRLVSGVDLIVENKWSYMRRLHKVYSNRFLYRATRWYFPLTHWPSIQIAMLGVPDFSKHYKSWNNRLSKCTGTGGADIGGLICSKNQLKILHWTKSLF